jgi:hypothetical protein
MNDMFEQATSFKQALCGAAWVQSKASKYDMFEGSSGSVSETVCTSVPTSATTQGTRQYVSRRPITERELIARTPSFTSTIAKTLRCSKCGTFQKSGRASCCAPGGAWFKNCGGVFNKNVDHIWSDGVNACKRKFKTPINDI